MTINTAEELAEWIDRKPYSTINGETHIDGGWLRIAIYVPTGDRRGLPLVWKTLKLFIRAAWRELS